MLYKHCLSPNTKEVTTSLRIHPYLSGVEAEKGIMINGIKLKMNKEYLGLEKIRNNE